MHTIKEPCVYMIASKRNGTLYSGVTSDLVGRVTKHKNGDYDGFTAKYGVSLLVWFEEHSHMDAAITREKQIKRWKREWKVALIEKSNPEWRDLFVELH